MPSADQSTFAFGQLDILWVTSSGSPALPRDGGASARLDLDLGGWPHGGRWALQLDTALGRDGDPMIVVAQGVACLAVAWWAQLSPKSYLQRVAGAVFVSPLSFSLSEAPVARSLRPSPGTRLPFPSIVASGASPIIAQVLDLGDIWGSQFVDLDASTDATRRALQGHPLARQTQLMELITASGSRGDGARHAEPAPLSAPFLLAAAGK